jgi:DNA-binding Lrp family transcriptional regulator
MKLQQPQMSPLDVVVLVKLCLQDGNASQMQIAQALELSQSEVSKSIARSRYAGLIFGKENQVMRQAFFDFLCHGVRYSFPQQPGPVVRGIPTAHSTAPLSETIQSDEPYVWPSSTGQIRGHSIVPLYPKIVIAVAKDAELHEVLALIDALRVGRARERNIAVEELKKRIC